MALILPYTSIDQFVPTTVHSDDVHNEPHNRLIANDISIAAAVVTLEGQVPALTASDAFWIQHSLVPSDGYQKFPGGLIIQWKVGAGMNTETSQVITWPIVFPTDVLIVQITPQGVVTPLSDSWFKLSSYTVSNVTVFLQATGSGLSQITYPHVLGFGY
jgi:hypothetical protein